MKKEIWFDMDGTIADLYSVENWLDDLQAERIRPYAEAKVMLNMQALARVLNRLIREGYSIGVISWTSKCGSREYNEAVAEVKRDWLKKHLNSVKFEKIHIVEYGTPKWIFAKSETAILFDDEERNRNDWKGIAYGVDNILKILKEF